MRCAWLLLAVVACGDRRTSPPPPPSPAPDPNPPRGPDLGFIAGEIIVLEERDGLARPVRLVPATATWEVLGSGSRHLFPSGHRAGGGLLCIATRGDSEEDHAEQLVIVRGPEVTPFGPDVRTVRSPTVVGERVVFESDATSYRDLYAFRLGSDQPALRLTHDEHGNFEPVLSPDGALVAFASSRDGNAELYVQAVAPDVAARRLTTSSGDDWNPMWAPDGRTLAFLSDRDGSARVHVIAATGGDARRLSSEPGAAVEAEPQWSPDGTRVVFERGERNRTTLVMIDVATRATRTLTPDGARDVAPAWSPDAAMVAAIRTTGRITELVFISVADGSVRAALPTNATLVRWFP